MAVFKILVIDDDPVIQKLLQVNFEIEGHEVIIASDGEQGLEFSASMHPDIVILDIMMPRMDGLEVAKKLRANSQTTNIPIILLSAKAQFLDISIGKETGADEYITKPFDPLLLLEKVEELISSSSV